MQNRGRLSLLDTIRGITMVSMILYHGTWDLVYLMGVSVPWYPTMTGYVWQQSICWSFILLSGFCIPLSHHPIRRGLQVSVLGLLITVILLIFMPEERILYGVLSFIGFAMIFCGLLQPVLDRIPAGIGLAASAAFFVFTKDIYYGYFGFGGVHFLDIPAGWYRNLFTAAFGLPAPDFYSTDYFPIIPWLFLYLCGYYLCRIMKKYDFCKMTVFGLHIPVFSLIGRHSLLIYVLHQPVLYVLICLLPQALSR